MVGDRVYVGGVMLFAVSKNLRLNGGRVCLDDKVEKYN